MKKILLSVLCLSALPGNTFSQSKSEINWLQNKINLYGKESIDTVLTSEADFKNYSSTGRLIELKEKSEMHDGLLLKKSCVTELNSEDSSFVKKLGCLYSETSVKYFIKAEAVSPDRLSERAIRITTIEDKVIVTSDKVDFKTKNEDTFDLYLNWDIEDGLYKKVLKILQKICTNKAKKN